MLFILDAYQMYNVGLLGFMVSIRSGCFHAKEGV
jgi:hypothetical protein